MNEVTKIHLGRQAFTAAVDAYDDLKAYLEAITKQVNDQEVLSEIEARMAELLTERGISSTKVILKSDVEFLKKQLGSPKDFTPEEATQDETKDPTNNRRLFRDTDNALIAGVAAGLAKYFGLDIALVRVLFVIFIFITVGWGIMLYILLWLLVPEAKTPSDKLLMAGKNVTIGSLKQVVENADIKGAAKRANRSIADFVNSLFKVVVKIVGLGFIASGLSALLALIAFITYFIARSSSWYQSNVFPIGFRENLLLGIAIGVVALMAVFVVLFGIALFRRSWPIKTWITGLLAGLVFIGIATGGALTADVYPTVRSAYDANLHTSYRQLPPFSSIQIYGDAPIGVDLQPASSNYVALKYYDRPNLANITTVVKNDVLTIDYSHFHLARNCATICVPNNYQMQLIVYTPNTALINSQSMPPIKMMPLVAPMPDWSKP